MKCIKCGGTIIAETIDAGSYDCCILRCLDCGTIVDKTSVDEAPVSIKLVTRID